jgi:glycosyltransferase involved in cell wall biosynthesis
VWVRSKHTVYDIDDADYLEQNARSIFYFVRKCYKVSAGSNCIITHLKPMNPRIGHVTSPVADLQIVKKKKEDIFTIGWIGGYGGEQRDYMLSVIYPALMMIDFRCRVYIAGVTLLRDAEEIQNILSSKNNLEVVIPVDINWHDEYEVQNLIVCYDVGIATLTASEMQISKSGIKAKQYLNNGVPVVCNDMPENNNVVIDGVNGFLCNSALAFAEAFRNIYDMSDAGYMMFSREARKSSHDFNHEAYFNSLNKLFNAG